MSVYSDTEVQSRLTQERLKEILDYEPDTGLFFWKVQTSNRAKVGYEAGALSNGYTVIGIDGTLFRANRLAWLYMTGEWPKEVIDHKNFKRNDNRWSNLRSITQKQNTAHGTNRTGEYNQYGVPGLIGNNGGRTILVKLLVDGKARHMGNFTSSKDAYEAYRDAKRLYHNVETPTFEELGAVEVLTPGRPYRPGRREEAFAEAQAYYDKHFAGKAQ